MDRGDDVAFCQARLPPLGSVFVSEVVECCELVGRGDKSLGVCAGVAAAECVVVDAAAEAAAVGHAVVPQPPVPEG